MAQFPSTTLLAEFFTCTWRPHVSVRHLPPLFSTVFFDILLQNPKDTSLGGLAGQEAAGIFLSLPPQHVSSCPAFLKTGFDFHIIVIQISIELWSIVLGKIYFCIHSFIQSVSHYMHLTCFQCLYYICVQYLFFNIQR